jgi:hypothetical protein
MSDPNYVSLARELEICEQFIERYGLGGEEAAEMRRESREAVQSALLAEFGAEALAGMAQEHAISRYDESHKPAPVYASPTRPMVAGAAFNLNAENIHLAIMKAAYREFKGKRFFKDSPRITASCLDAVCSQATSVALGGPEFALVRARGYTILSKDPAVQQALRDALPEGVYDTQWHPSVVRLVNEKPKKRTKDGKLVPEQATVANAEQEVVEAKDGKLVPETVAVTANANDAEAKVERGVATEIVPEKETMTKEEMAEVATEAEKAGPVERESVFNVRLFDFTGISRRTATHMVRLFGALDPLTMARDADGHASLSISFPSSVFAANEELVTFLGDTLSLALPLLVRTTKTTEKSALICEYNLHALTAPPSAEGAALEHQYADLLRLYVRLFHPNKRPKNLLATEMVRTFDPTPILRNKKARQAGKVAMAKFMAKKYSALLIDHVEGEKKDDVHVEGEKKDDVAADVEDKGEGEKKDSSLDGDGEKKD